MFHIVLSYQHQLKQSLKKSLNVINIFLHLLLSPAYKQIPNITKIHK